MVHLYTAQLQTSAPLPLPNPLTLLCVSTPGCAVAVASSDGTVKVVQPGLGQLHSLQGHGETEMQSVAFHCPAERLLSGAADGTVCLWTYGASASMFSMERTA